MNYGMSSRFSPEEVLQMAALFFGPEGLGLDIVTRRPGRLEFAGRQGAVTVRTESLDGSTEVLLTTRGLDALVRRFMAEVSEEARQR